MRLARPLILALAATIGVAACTSTAERYDQATAVLEFQGKLRTEVEPADAPFTNQDLARNFIEVALYSEYIPGHQRREPKTLRRWQSKIKYTYSGDSATQEDRQNTRELIKRIEALTPLSFEENDKYDLLIGIFNSLIKDRFGAEFVSFQEIWASNFNTPCVGRLIQNEDGSKGLAMMFIKDELSGIQRKACLHEEITQALGLTNDGDDIRPSIFNDDQEFALLTRHDEYLLQILYDDRLSFGMTEDEVRPLLPEIIADIRPEGEGAL